MANRLKVGWVQAIETLLTRGWSYRRIAQTLGIDRGTVSRYRLRAIRRLIQHQGTPQEQFEFIHEHPIIRKLSDYGDLVRSAL